jgi:hypothetical protein
MESMVAALELQVVDRVVDETTTDGTTNADDSDASIEKATTVATTNVNLAKVFIVAFIPSFRCMRVFL